MEKKKKKKKQEAKPDPSTWSPKARQQFEEGEQVLRLMGLDEGTIQAMKKAMVDLYDPATGEFRLEDFELFKDAMLPSLMESSVMEDTLSSTELLEDPQLKRFWYSAEQLRPCIAECHNWLEKRAAEHGILHPGEILFDEERSRERREMGQLLYRRYDELVTQELADEVYNCIFKLSQDGSEDQRAMAKNAMVCFTLFPGKSNAFLQFLFIKSLVLRSEIADEIEEIVDEQDRSNAIAAFEDAFFAILCEGEDALWQDATPEEDEEE